MLSVSQTSRLLMSGIIRAQIRTLQFKRNISIVVSMCHENHKIKNNGWPSGSTKLLNSTKNGVTLSNERTNLCYSSTSSSKLKYHMKPFIETENEFFHQVLESTPMYGEYLFGLNAEPRTKMIVDGSDINLLLVQMKENGFYDQSKCDRLHVVMEALTTLAHLDTETKCRLLEDKGFYSLCSHSLDNMETLNDEELFRVLELLAKFPFRKYTPGMENSLRAKAISTFDKEFTKRANTWDVKKLLKAADFFYILRCTKMTSLKYMDSFFQKMMTHVSSLSDQEIVLLLFHTSLSRRIPDELHHILLSNQKLLSTLPNLSLDEIAIVCIGFFKSKKMIYSNMLSLAIADSILKHSVNVHPITLSAIYKSFSNSFDKGAALKNPPFFAKMTSLADLVALKFKEYPISTVVHVVAFYQKISFSTEKMMKLFVDKLMASDISRWRLKDIARAWHILGNVDVDVQSFFNSTVEELSVEHRKEELSTFGGELLTVLLGMASHDMYCLSIIDEVFSSRFQKRFRGYKLDHSRDLYQLNECIAIDRPNYDGNRLPSNFLSKLPKNHLVFPRQPQLGPGITNRSTRDCILADLVKHLDKIVGKKNCQVKFCLPHFQTADVVFSLDSVNLNENKKDVKNGSQVLPRNVLLLFAKTAYFTLQDSDGQKTLQLTGLHQMKLRQLERTGYNVIQLPFYEYEGCDDCEVLLRSKISSFKK